ncbi:MAG: hypothetical protein NZ903_02875, partial [Candidatus Micrarchaeota archaeon]|nr:hypothetical protein [Candidatus Micrarchaeota archaeon]
SIIDNMPLQSIKDTESAKKEKSSSIQHERVEEGIGVRSASQESNYGKAASHKPSKTEEKNFCEEPTKKQNSNLIKTIGITSIAAIGIVGLVNFMNSDRIKQYLILNNNVQPQMTNSSNKISTAVQGKNSIVYVIDGSKPSTPADKEASETAKPSVPPTESKAPISVDNKIDSDKSAVSKSSDEKQEKPPAFTNKKEIEPEKSLESILDEIVQKTYRIPYDGFPIVKNSTNSHIRKFVKDVKSMAKERKLSNKQLNDIKTLSQLVLANLKINAEILQEGRGKTPESYKISKKFMKSIAKHLKWLRSQGYNEDAVKYLIKIFRRITDEHEKL